MYDLNLSVPNVTASKYSVDNKFLMLKNYLQELNEALAFALGDKTEAEVRSIREDIQKDKSLTEKKQIQLQAQSVERFNRLKEQIILTAEELEKSYKADIETNEKGILATVESLYYTKSAQGEFENEVGTAFNQMANQLSLMSIKDDSIASDLENFKQSSRSELTLQSDAIISQVENNFQSKTEAGEMESRIASQITQTENVINENFSKELSVLTEDVSTVGGAVNEFISDLDVYIRRGELETDVYGIEIGRSDSNIKARFTNDRLSFYQGAGEVAYISGSSLYITNADILDYLRIGNSVSGYFLFDTTTNGLEVRWIDAN